MLELRKSTEQIITREMKIRNKENREDKIDNKKNQNVNERNNRKSRYY